MRSEICILLYFHWCFRVLFNSKIDSSFPHFVDGKDESLVQTKVRILFTWTQPVLSSLVSQLNKKTWLKKESSSRCCKHWAVMMRNGDARGNHIGSKARAVHWGEDKVGEKRKQSWNYISYHHSKLYGRGCVFKDLYKTKLFHKASDIVSL